MTMKNKRVADYKDTPVYKVRSQGLKVIKAHNKKFKTSKYIKVNLNGY
jgi:hypothetical protein